ncbi:MAG: hypothetical protein QOD98_4595 [Nocardioidaceae bacterium]|jgi:hypothetical protein|nr:hypothetical protein [Nocardioidaceae bacterium]
MFAVRIDATPYRNQCPRPYEVLDLGVGQPEIASLVNGGEAMLRSHDRE